MRILIGMPDKDSLGGPIYCEPPFVRALRAAGAEVDEEVYVYGEGRAATPFTERILRVVKAARLLQRRTLEGRYDVIHLNTSFDEKCVIRDLFTLLRLRSSGVPVYLKMHGSIARFLKTESKFWRYLQRQVFSRAAGIGVLSIEERENFERAGCPADKLSIAKLAVDADAFQPDSKFTELHGLTPGTPILLFSSRFIAAKGLVDVITAAAEVKAAGRDLALLCLGDGPERINAENLVAELELGDTVRFFGYIPEVETAAFHANSTIFVFPTYHDEGFPLVILKSLAAGLPIITTRIRAAADYLKDPENCLWAEPRSPLQLAGLIIRLLDDDELRTAMATNNRHLAQEFSAERVASDHIGVYRGLTGKGQNLS